MHAAHLWKIFDEECKKLHITALCFGDGPFGRSCGQDGPPFDLTVWENVLRRIEMHYGRITESGGPQ